MFVVKWNNPGQLRWSPKECFAMEEKQKQQVNVIRKSR
jgi:hypothetical protein